MAKEIGGSQFLKQSRDLFSSLAVHLSSSHEVYRRCSFKFFINKEVVTRSVQRWSVLMHMGNVSLALVD